jgi:hypothetical protein
MTEQAQAYPLHWPPGFPRTKYAEAGRFKVSHDAALANVVRSLNLFAKDSCKVISEAILSSNMSLLDRQPVDAGVAVWFRWDGLQLCIPSDRYLSAAANLQAVHHIIEARRIELRHGSLHLVRASFAGFRALPAPKGKHWREVLRLQDVAKPGADAIEKAYRALAADRHPDNGGSHDAMADLNAARDTAKAEMGA